jgi:NAD(P)-dependent dehydrogenase (short-subunit alcohol dehydrogenase family)
LENFYKFVKDFFMNKVALITGASRGIGRGIAIELAKCGFDLILNFARNLDSATETKQICFETAERSGKSIRVELAKADISLKDERDFLVNFARENFGQIDLLVNNAGVAPHVRADILEAGEESFDRLISINVKAPYFLTQSIAKWMIEKKTTMMDYSPKIVFVTSISAYTASVNRGDYCISKAALSMACQLFAARLAEYGINVYEVRPGIIETDMTKPVKEKYDKLIDNGLTPIRRWGTPEDVGKAVAAIALGYLQFSTGEIINVDGGFCLRIL